MRRAACCAAGFGVLLTVPAWGQDIVSNGDFTDGLASWTTWTVHNDGAGFQVTAPDGELHISGSDFAGGIYQQLTTGGPGNVVNVVGYWRGEPPAAGAVYAEVWVINDDRLPADGTDEADGADGAILLYRNDTLDGRGAWGGPIARSAPVVHRISFTAAADKATLILKSGNNGSGSATNAVFDKLAVHIVPPPATADNLPPGFARRTHVFPVSDMVSIAQSPVSRHIYTIRNNQAGGSTLLYRIDVGGPAITATQVADLSSTATINPGFSEAQGITFDPGGNLYVSNRLGRIIKGVDTNPDAATDTFAFSQMFDLPDPQIGTFHGIGGVAVGPDQMLYINSGSETHYGPEADKGFNMRILRTPLNATGVGDVQTFCEGIRNSFDIGFRADGRLFGVGNGPNINCDYAEEFNLLEQGQHYGFPYAFASDLSGADQSIACNDDPPNVGPQPIPPGLSIRPAWANYGPDAKPAPGERGYANGGEYYGFNPHSSPNGLDFYEPELMDPAAIKFPAEFHGRAFVARFGQLEDFALADNPHPPNVGFDVLSLRLDDAGEGLITNTFLAGLGRAVDVLCAYNGRLYVLEFNQQTGYPAGGWGSPGRLHEIAYTIPSTPLISLGRTTLARTIDYGEAVSGNDTFTIANGGIGTLHYAISVAFEPPGTPAWLEVTPATGDSTGPDDADTITVSYNSAAVAGLGIGTHLAIISAVDPAAPNSPATVSASIEIKTVLPDLDADGDVDQSDYGLLQACLSGPGAAPEPGCEPADFQKDGDVDTVEVGVFLGCLSGARVMADRNCDDAYE